MWLPGTFLNQSSDTEIKVKIGQNLKIKSTVKGLRTTQESEPHPTKKVLNLLLGIEEVVLFRLFVTIGHFDVTRDKYLRSCSRQWQANNTNDRCP